MKVLLQLEQKQQQQQQLDTACCCSCHSNANYLQTSKPEIRKETQHHHVVSNGVVSSPVVRRTFVVLKLETEQEDY